MKTLKPAHERFLQAMLQCHSQTEAYLVAYPNSSPASAKANASRLLKREPEIRRRLNENHEMLMEQVHEKREAALWQAFAAFWAEQEIYAAIMNGGPVVRLLPNGKVVSVPSTLDDRLRAANRYRRNEEVFLAQYPICFDLLRPDAAQTAEGGDNKGYQNCETPAA